MSAPATVKASPESDLHVRWLRFFQELSPASNPETVRLMGQLHQVAHALYQSSEARLQQEADMSVAQYRILMTLLFSEQSEGRAALNPSEISRMRGTSRNTISALIRSLEQDGLVARELDPHDRRKFNIGLTDAGRDAVRRHADAHFALVEAVFAVLDEEEVAVFGRILTKLTAAVPDQP